MLIEFCSELEIRTARNEEDDEQLDARLRAGRQNEEGFTLIELLIVMSVMLILMTLAVPQMLKLTKQAHETSAIQSVRTIGQAQLQYNSALSGEWFCLLAAGARWRSEVGRSFVRSLRNCFRPIWPAAQKAGYTFAITNCTKVTVNNQDMITSYEMTAVPNSIGQDRRSRLLLGREQHAFASTRPVEPTARSRFSNAGRSASAVCWCCSAAPFAAGGAG